MERFARIVDIFPRVISLHYSELVRVLIVHAIIAVVFIVVEIYGLYIGRLVARRRCLVSLLGGGG